MLQNSESRIHKLRDYQKTLILNSLEKNSIIYLPTGKGKTLVSLAHIIFHNAKLGNSRPGKKVIFVANTIQLVKQQFEFIRREYNQVKELLKDCGIWEEFRQRLDRRLYELRVEDFVFDCVHGSRAGTRLEGESTKALLKRGMGDNWKSLKKRYDEANGLVLIAQMFVDAVQKGLIPLQEISLVVFDECHHAKGRSPYNIFMRDIYEYHQRTSPKMELPQIVGLTASPVMESSREVGAIRHRLMELAVNLDCGYAGWLEDEYRPWDEPEQAIRVECPYPDECWEGKSPYFDYQKMIHNFEHIQSLSPFERAARVEILKIEFPELYELISECRQVFKECELDSSKPRSMQFEAMRDELMAILEIKMPYLWLELGTYTLSRFFLAVNDKLSIDLRSIYQEQVNRIKTVF